MVCKEMNGPTIPLELPNTPVLAPDRQVTTRVRGITDQLKYSPVGLSYWEKRVCDVLIEVDLNWKKCSEVVKIRFNREFSPRLIERWVRGSRRGDTPGRAHLISYLQEKIAEKSLLEGFTVDTVKMEAILIYKGKQVSESQVKALEMIKDLELRKVAKDQGPRMAVQINFGERK